MTKPLDSDELWAVVITCLPFGGLKGALYGTRRESVKTKKRRTGIPSTVHPSRKCTRMCSERASEVKTTISSSREVVSLSYGIVPELYHGRQETAWQILFRSFIAVHPSLEENFSRLRCEIHRR